MPPTYTRLNKRPLYKEVKEELIQALAAGDWQPGGRIPVEADLAKRYNVGIATVRAAVAELEAAGILTRMQGKGTFVSEHAHQSRLYRFFNLVRPDGVRATPMRDFISLRRDRATEDERQQLQLARYGATRSVYRLRSAFSLQGECVGVGDAVLPCGLFPGLSKRGVADGNLTLYALYQSNYNVNVIAVTADLSARAAPADVAVLLGVKKGAPLLCIERRAYTYQDVPVELRTSWVNTRGWKFRVDQGSTV